jgi:hypothetical protein
LFCVAQISNHFLTLSTPYRKLITKQLIDCTIFLQKAHILLNLVFKNPLHIAYKGIFKISLDYPFHFHIFASDLNISQ